MSEENGAVPAPAPAPEKKKSTKEAEERIKLLEQQVKIIEAEQDAKFKEMDEAYKKRMDDKLISIRHDLNTTLEARLATIGDNYTDHGRENIDNMRLDVLRCNKIIREVSRSLGTNWRPVFRQLMSGLPLEFAHSEQERIEYAKPYLQPFKALLAWRDAMGAELDIGQLVDALNSVGECQLADRALAILHSSESDLYIVNDIGRGITHGSAAGFDGENHERSLANGGQCHYEAQLAGALSDRHLLHLAKKLGSDWPALGKALSIDDEEIEEIQKSDGDESQAAFRLLWVWRESVSRTQQDNPTILAEALNAVGRSDLSENYKKEAGI